MKEDIINLIENESENTRLDFKLEQYPIEKGTKKGEFLKDMCAFANLLSKEDKFIIVGVEEKNGVANGFKSIDKLNDQAAYQQFLNQYIEPEINFEYKELLHKENRLAYFRLFNNDQKPFLFKKEYRDMQPKGSHYRIGTGFVRTGTSTRELIRDDFEKIYAGRVGTRDRSEDIDFDITLGGFRYAEFRSTIYRHLQIDIINLSNTSLDLDVEAKIYNIEGVTARCTQEIEQKMHEDRRNDHRRAYFEMNTPGFIFMDKHVDFNNHGRYSIYETTPVKGTLTSIRVKQQGTLTDIFNDQIALVFSKPAEVKIELKVSCNDFPNGPKTFNFSFSKEETKEVLDPLDL